MSKRRFTGGSTRRPPRVGGAAKGLFKLAGPKLRPADRLPNARGGPKRGSPATPADRRSPLDQAKWRKLEDRRAVLERKYADDYARFRHDPDQKRVHPGSEEEARTALDMRERGLLPRDVDRPPVSGKGDFVATVDGKQVHYDVKTWKDLVPGERGVYRSTRFEENILDEIRRDRVVILDTRDLKQWVIDDMVRVVNQNGWSRHVIWYP